MVAIALAVITPFAADAAPVDFAHEVVPVLRKHCVSCHGGKEAKGSFSINTRALVVDSGMIETGAPDESHLLELVTSSDKELQMPPPDKPRVSPDEIALLRRWIQEDLAWEAGFSFAGSTYEPPLRPRRPKLPSPRNGRDNPIDRILDDYLVQRNLPRPEAVSDGVFLRRAYLDLNGILPTAEQLDEFIQDDSPAKRDAVIDRLLENDIGYADHWLTFFNDLLRNDYSGTGFITGGRKQITAWLYRSLVENKPFDQLARELIAPPGASSRGYIDGIKWRGEVSAGQTIPIQFAQSVSQSFLGINLKCASCHDSFIDRWTLKEAYGLAAIYASETLELHRCDKPTGDTAQAAWLFPELGTIDASADQNARLIQLANLMTHPENGRFTRTIVNRLWHRLMGRGIVHPLDAMQQPPWNADLLDFLADDLAKSKYDLKATLRRIATSQAYQSETEIVEEDSPGEYIYRGPRARRMTAEQMLDSIWQLTEAAPKKFDAPLFRSVVSEQRAKELEFSAKWIWGPLTNRSVPGGEAVSLRKTFKLESNVSSGGAVITCDNSFTLFVNGREVDSGDDWTRFYPVSIRQGLKKGSNSIIVVARNGADTPNPAGLFFEARLTLADGTQMTIASDESWQWNKNLPTPRESRLGRIAGTWQAATVVPTIGPWEAAANDQGKRMLASIVSGGDVPMVRASLLKNNALMKSLGRPIRDQIVSMRPGSLTTLEAIDLANEPTLSKTFADGAATIANAPWKDTPTLVRDLFRSALSRDPTDQECELFVTAVGSEPNAETLQDALWAICMLPEFMMVR